MRWSARPRNGAQPKRHPADVVVEWKRASLTVVDHDLIVGEITFTEHSLDELPADAPGPDDSDVIDCTPDG
ncbi:MAG: hypothetical protein R2695_09815 [Acidimicrobiales bacterium]